VEYVVQMIVPSITKVRKRELVGGLQLEVKRKQKDFAQRQETVGRSRTPALLHVNSVLIISRPLR